ncbi:MAG: UvrD-helicase domain-containing protein [Planctomycetes bacterium]|nr:UvrD-helicase domain-containing protein [Planctomycetota bacterium]
MASERDKTKSPRPIASPILADQPSRSAITDDLDTCMLVEASAGTGKTHSMVSRMAGLVKTGRCGVENIAAVTFTRKAAAELRSRFQLALEELAAGAEGEERQRLGAALAGVESGFIGTIHSFCGRLLRERPVEAGVGLDFVELDQQDDELLRREAWLEYLAGLNADGPSQDLLNEILAAGLEPEQLEQAFNSLADYPDVDDWPAGDVDIPRGQIEQARNALKKYLAHIMKILRDLPENPGNDDLMPRYQELARLARQGGFNRDEQLLAVLEKFESGKVKIVQKNWAGGARGGMGQAELDRWNRFAADVAGPLTELWRRKRYHITMKALGPAVEHYDRLRHQRGLLNFQDLLMKAAGLLRNNPSVRRFFRRRFTHVLVDEFQDTDPIQAQVMLYLAADDPSQADWTACRPAPGSLFVVGDPKQSIYRFRRADIETYFAVRRIIEGAGGRCVTLSANFRATGGLIDWVNFAYSRIFPKKPDEFSPSCGKLEKGGGESAPANLCGLWRLTAPDGANKWEIVAHDADRIARFIRWVVDTGKTVSRPARKLAAGMTPAVRPEDFLIICYGKKTLSVYASRLRELGVPCEVSGGSLMSESGELVLLHACLLAAAEPENRIAALAVLRSELFGFSDVELFEFVAAGGRFYYPAPRVAAGKSWSGKFTDAFARLNRHAGWLANIPGPAAVERIIDDLGLWALACTRADPSGAAGCLYKAVELIRSGKYDRWSSAGMVEYLGMLLEGGMDLDGMAARPPERAGVRIMNLHKAKGLEAPVVFLADPTGWQDKKPALHVSRFQENRSAGYLAVKQPGFHGKLLAIPDGWDQLAGKESQFLAAERLRLLYVAATRAGSMLCVSTRHGRENQNPWHPLDEYLACATELKDPANYKFFRPAAVEVTIDQAKAGVGGLARAWKKALEKTYQTGGAKALALEGDFLSGYGQEGAAQWGSVIHSLLDSAMRRPDCQLAALARQALADNELPVNLADRAVETVRGVMESEIWRRARQAQQIFTEIDIQCPILPGGQSPMKSGQTAATDLPGVVRGVIDLAFREPAGWVIVDYKTDTAPPTGLETLIERYNKQLAAYADLWRQSTGQQVAETGLLFVRYGKYCTC